MKRYIALLAALMLALISAGCTENKTLEETRIYRVEGDVHSLDIEIGAADFVIKHADGFSVESNLKYLSVSEKNGVLAVVESEMGGGVYDEPMLILCIAEGMTFESINILTGAARVTADVLSAERLKLELGAGDMYAAAIYAQKHAEIEGGAGRITIDGGLMHNLKLAMGIGELNMTAQLMGESELSLGVGESNITLIGSVEDYSVVMERGIGSISVDGDEYNRFESSGGEHAVIITGGIGEINLKFMQRGNAMPL